MPQLSALLLSSVFLVFATGAWAQKKHNNHQHNNHQEQHNKKKKSAEEEEGLQVNESCKREESLEKIKSDIVPYRFDKVTTTRITYKAYDKVYTVAVPLFNGNTYKLIVNAEGMPTPVQVKITDKPLKATNVKVLYEGSEAHITYETPPDFEGTRVYVSVKIPADPEYNNGIRNRGCILVGAGYQSSDF